MAQVKHLVGWPTADPDEYFDMAVNGGDVSAPTGSKFVVKSPDGSKIVFHGDFTVAGGEITGGTVKSFEVYAGATKVETGKGFDLDAAQLFDLAGAHDAYELGQFIAHTPTKYVGSGKGDGLDGGEAKDRIYGRDGDDWLGGGGRSDKLYGGKGDDSLAGDEGSDQLTGGPGHDAFRFFFRSSMPESSADKITDFKPGKDLIVLYDVDRALPVGHLQDKFFHKGHKAKDGNDTVIYQKDTGKVFFDADGAGGDPAFLLLKVKAGTALHAHDFYVGNLFLTA